MTFLYSPSYSNRRAGDKLLGSRGQLSQQLNWMGIFFCLLVATLGHGILCKRPLGPLNVVCLAFSWEVISLKDCRGFFVFYWF